MPDLTPRVKELVGRLAGASQTGIRLATRGSPSELRPGEPGFDDVVAQLEAMSLDRYAVQGAPLEIRVPWHGETLWFVPDERRAEILVLEGVTRGRIWTAEELRAVPVASRDIIRIIAITKVAVSGDVVEVRRTRSAGDETGDGPGMHQPERDILPAGEEHRG